MISDKIIIRITADPGNSFLDRMISLVEGAKRQKTPNEIALSILLMSLTLVFILAVVTLKFFADYSAKKCRPGFIKHRKLTRFDCFIGVFDSNNDWRIAERDWH